MTVNSAAAAIVDPADGALRAEGTMSPGVATTVVVVSGSVLSTLIPLAIIPAMPAMSRTIAAGANGELFAQLVTTLPAAVMAIASPLTGWAVRQFGFRRYLIACLLLYVVSGLAGLFATNLTELVLSRLVLGLAGGGVAALPFALAGSFPPAVRDRLIGFAGSAGGIAGIVALNAGGALVDSWGWRGPFILYALGIAVAIIAWRGGTEVPKQPVTDKVAGGSLRSIFHLYLLLFLLAVGFYVPSLAGPFVLEAAGVNSATHQGFLLSLFSISSILSASAFGFLRRYASTLTIAALSATCLSGGAAAMVLLQGPQLVAIGLIAAGIGAGFAAPAVISEILSRVTPDTRAKAMGLKVTAIFMAQFLTPFLLHPVQSRFGLSAAILAVGGMLFATALWALFLGRAQARTVPTAG